MKRELLEILTTVVAKLGIAASTVKLEYPEDLTHGDFSTNVALVNAKTLKISPKALAEKIVAAFQVAMPESVSSVEVAGPGFVNFTLKDSVFAREVTHVAANDPLYGHDTSMNSQKIMVEYTDPNTFKVFHIGHLMSNAIGESISRLIESAGASLIRICYPSDIGLHIAKSIWAMQKHSTEIPIETAPIQERTAFLGKMYVEGTEAYESDLAAKDTIDALNKVIYEMTSDDIKLMYEKGRRWSLDHFDVLYKLLGTKFDETIFESAMAPVGLEIVRAHTSSANKSAVFEESEGAVVFKGEEYGLHTRVFINSHGLPTYEAKEVGLNVTKFDKHPDAVASIIVTASEQNDYFKVLLKVLSLIDKDNGTKTRHIGHGMMRFASGKMSSRTGNVITAESLITDMRKLVMDKIADRDFTDAEAGEISDTIAVGAIKYSIIRSSIGSDIVFDSAASISFEGDSGPYLQYAAVRARSVLEKHLAMGDGTIADFTKMSTPKNSALPEKVGLLEKLITRFPDIVSRARTEYAPQHVAGYLIQLAGAFNSFYANQTIIVENDPLTPYRIALTSGFLTTMTNGLWLLGISVPKKM